MVKIGAIIMATVNDFDDPALIFKEKNGGRCLVMELSPYFRELLKEDTEEISIYARPYRLAYEIIQSLGAKIVAGIVDREGGLYGARLLLIIKGRKKVVKCMPIDIALLYFTERFQIYSEEETFKKSGHVINMDEGYLRHVDSDDSTGPEEWVMEEYLGPFADVIKDLNLDDFDSKK